MKFTARGYIKLMLTNECLTQKALVELLTKKTGKNHRPDSFSQKLINDTISFREVAQIADILGYEIKFVKS